MGLRDAGYAATKSDGLYPALGPGDLSNILFDPLVVQS